MWKQYCPSCGEEYSLATPLRYCLNCDSVLKFGNPQDNAKPRNKRVIRRRANTKRKGGE